MHVKKHKVDATGLGFLRDMRQRAQKAAQWALLSWLVGCGSDASHSGPPSVAAAAPPDAVLRVDGREYITRAEVEHWLECVALLEPNASRPQLLRLALTNFVLPRAVARNIDRAAYEETGRRAKAIHAKLLEGGLPGEDLPPSTTSSATWKEVGLDIWWESRQREVGQWSEPYETVGGFVIWRVLAEPELPLRPTAQIRIERLLLPYIPSEGPQALVEQAIFEGKLEVLDPEWEELVPLIYRNEMEAEVVSPGATANHKE